VNSSAVPFIPAPKIVPVRIDSRKSHGFREQMRIGAALANNLTVVTPLSEAAAKIGISKTMIRRIECRALYKVACALKAMRAQEEA
jgi:hypothetical protein